MNSLLKPIAIGLAGMMLMGSAAVTAFADTEKNDHDSSDSLTMKAVQAFENAQNKSGLLFEALFKGKSEKEASDELESKQEKQQKETAGKDSSDTPAGRNVNEQNEAQKIPGAQPQADIKGNPYEAENGPMKMKDPLLTAMEAVEAMDEGDVKSELQSLIDAVLEAEEAERTAGEDEKDTAVAAVESAREALVTALEKAGILFPKEMPSEGQRKKPFSESGISRTEAKEEGSEGN